MNINSNSNKPLSMTNPCGQFNIFTYMIQFFFSFSNFCLIFSLSPSILSRSSYSSLLQTLADLITCVYIHTHAHHTHTNKNVKRMYVQNNKWQHKYQQKQWHMTGVCRDFLLPLSVLLISFFGEDKLTEEQRLRSKFVLKTQEFNNFLFNYWGRLCVT